MEMQPSEPRTEAYLVWCTEGEQDTRKTAELCGIPLRTIQRWMRVDDWRGTWIATTAPESEQAAQQGKLMMRHAIPTVAKRLLAIVGGTKPAFTLTGQPILDAEGKQAMVWSSEDKDAVQAAKVLALYGLGSPLSVTDVGDTSMLASYSVRDPTPRPEGEEQTLEQLRAEVSQAIEATVASVNTRTTPSRNKRRV